MYDKGRWRDSLFNLGRLHIVPTSGSMYCELFLFLVILSIWHVVAGNLPEHLLFCYLVLVRATQLKHIIMPSSSQPKFFHMQFQMCSATHVINILWPGLHHHLIHLQMGREKLQLAQFWILNFILQSFKIPVTSQREIYLATLVTKTREKSVAGQA